MSIVFDRLRNLAKYALEKKDKRKFFLAARVMYREMYRNLPNTEKHKACHAEFRALKNAQFPQTIYVARAKKNGRLGNAFPCPTCRQEMKRRGVSVCYFSIDENCYGVLEFNP